MKGLGADELYRYLIEQARKYAAMGGRYRKTAEGYRRAARKLAKTYQY